MCVFIVSFPLNQYCKVLLLCALLLLYRYFDDIPGCNIYFSWITKGGIKNS